MIDTILFDVDGVLLSEEGYFDASALTVWELLVSPAYLGLSVQGLPPYTPTPDAAAIRSIRATVFDGDRVLDFMKQRGINANWDMVYLQFAAQLLRVITRGGEPVRQQIRRAGLVPAEWQAENLKHLAAGLGLTQSSTETDLAVVEQAPDAKAIDFAAFANWFSDCATKEALFAKLSAEFAHYRLNSVTSDERTLWEVLRQAFQAWYLGDAHFDGPPSGKSGFLQTEIPLVPVDGLRRMLDSFVQSGIRLGIATGRPRIETYVPLEELGWLSAFDNASITTATDVVDAEADWPEARPLAKPHPFAYLRSYLQTTDVDVVLSQSVPISSNLGQNVLVVGDSVADWMAARRAGFQFAAVLTGLTGEAARAKFEELGCDWILGDVLELGNVEFGDAELG